MNPPDHYDNIDPDDYKKVLAAILKQALEDYVKLQHPKARTKKYLQEAFESAVGLIFDPEYRIGGVKNDVGDDLSLDDLTTTVLEGGTADPKQLREYAVSTAHAFWERKRLQAIVIPENLVFDGWVYDVVHSDGEPWIDHEDLTIYCGKHQTRTNEEIFFELAIQVVRELDPSSKKDPVKFARALYRLFRINDCFVSDLPL